MKDPSRARVRRRLPHCPKRSHEDRQFTLNSARGSAKPGPGRQSASLAIWQRYWLFQLPGLGVVAVLVVLGAYWFDLPGWTIPFVLGVWIVKDLLMYPFLKPAYEGPKPTGPKTMVGSLGTVTEDLCPRGYVRIGPELWRAESAAPIRAGRSVRVTGCEGMTMLVEPAGPEPEAST